MGGGGKRFLGAFKIPQKVSNRAATRKVLFGPSGGASGSCSPRKL